MLQLSDGPACRKEMAVMKAPLPNGTSSCATGNISQIAPWYPAVRSVRACCEFIVFLPCFVIYVPQLCSQNSFCPRRVMLQVDDLLLNDARWLACVRLCFRTKQTRIRDRSACEFASALVLHGLRVDAGLGWCGDMQCFIVACCIFS